MSRASTMARGAGRGLGAAGALLCAAAVALSAYATHGVAPEARTALQLAALFAFGHGLALAVLARGRPRRLAWVALACLLLGTVLFSGALVLAELGGLRARTAPLGGGLLIAGWLLHAVDALRRR